jgi:hypothetical protein
MNMWVFWFQMFSICEKMAKQSLIPIEVKIIINHVDEHKKTTRFAKTNTFMLL